MAKNNDKLFLSVIDVDQIKVIIEDCIKSELRDLFQNNSKSPPNELISRKEAASILGISLPTLSSWTKQGKVPAYRIGCSVRYKREEVYNSLSQVKSVKNLI
jgi:excisionase family DNA binding protein